MSRRDTPMGAAEPDHCRGSAAAVGAANELGDFLRGRRMELHPEDVGLPATARAAALLVCGARRSLLWLLSALTTWHASSKGAELRRGPPSARSPRCSASTRPAASSCSSSRPV